MNFDLLLKSRRGAILMMVLVIIAVGSIAAMRMLPNEELVVRRVAETELHTSLSQIREAVEMKYIAEGYQRWPFLDAINHATDSEKIHEMLVNLASEGYLRSENISEPTIALHLWGHDEGYYYWCLSENIASYSSSFADGWDMIEGATISSDYLWAPELDDYPNQNKLGGLIAGDGESLKITN